MAAISDPSQFDSRRHPVRSDLAGADYRGRVSAPRFAEGVRYVVRAPVTPLVPRPRPDTPIDTQALFGEHMRVYDIDAEGWAWGQLETDGYVGYVSAEALDIARTPTHAVSAPYSYRYPGPDLKLPPIDLLSIGARVTVTDTWIVRNLEYALLAEGGAMVARHLSPLGQVVQDWVAVAESLIGAAYLWGGRSALGLDCSALVQLAAQYGGHRLPRDTDMQHGEAGEKIAEMADDPRDTPPLMRGDLVFWRGHVGIMQDDANFLHASGHHMQVVSEPAPPAFQRLAGAVGPITAIRRLQTRVSNNLERALTAPAVE